MPIMVSRPLCTSWGFGNNRGNRVITKIRFIRDIVAITVFRVIRVISGITQIKVLKEITVLGVITVSG